MKTIQIKAAWNGHSDCLSCGIRQSALFSDIPEDQFADFHQQVDDLEFPKDAAIFHQGSAADHVYTLRSGLIKIVLLAPSGEERILRVIQPGALAGLDAITTGRYGHTAVALGAVKVCRLPIPSSKSWTPSYRCCTKGSWKNGPRRYTRPRIGSPSSTLAQQNSVWRAFY